MRANTVRCLIHPSLNTPSFVVAGNREPNGGGHLLDEDRDHKLVLERLVLKRGEDTSVHVRLVDHHHPARRRHLLAVSVGVGAGVAHGVELIKDPRHGRLSHTATVRRRHQHVHSHRCRHPPHFFVREPNLAFGSRANSQAQAHARVRTRWACSDYERRSSRQNEIRRRVRAAQPIIHRRGRRGRPRAAPT